MTKALSNRAGRPHARRSLAVRRTPAPPYSRRNRVNYLKNRREYSFQESVTDKRFWYSRPELFPLSLATVVIAFLERRCEYAERSDHTLRRELALLLAAVLAVTVTAGGLAVAAGLFVSAVILAQQAQGDTLLSLLPAVLTLASAAGSGSAAILARLRRGQRRS